MTSVSSSRDESGLGKKILEIRKGSHREKCFSNVFDPLPVSKSVIFGSGKNGIPVKLSSL